MPRGELATTPLGAVLRDLAGTAATGCLHLHLREDIAAELGGDGEGEAVIYLRDGCVYAAFLPGWTDRLGTRLVSLGLLAPDGLAEALQAQESELIDWQLGELLVNLGYVEESVVVVAGLEELHEAVAELSRCTVGRWRFRRNERCRRGLVQPQTVEDLLAEVARRNRVWADLLPVVGGLDAIPALSAGAAPDSLSLDPLTWALLCKVDGVRSVRDLAAEGGLSRLEAARTIASLVEHGVLDVIDIVSVDESDAEDDHDDEVAPLASVGGTRAAISAIAAALAGFDPPRALADPESGVAADAGFVVPLQETHQVAPSDDISGLLPTDLIGGARRPAQLWLQPDNRDDPVAASLARLSEALRTALPPDQTPPARAHVEMAMPDFPKARREPVDPELDRRRERIRNAAAAELAAAHAAAEQARPHAPTPAPVDGPALPSLAAALMAGAGEHGRPTAEAAPPIVGAPAVGPAATLRATVELAEVVDLAARRLASSLRRSEPAGEAGAGEATDELGDAVATEPEAAEPEAAEPADVSGETAESAESAETADDASDASEASGMSDMARADEPPTAGASADEPPTAGARADEPPTAGASATTDASASDGSADDPASTPEASAQREESEPVRVAVLDLVEAGTVDVEASPAPEPATVPPTGEGADTYAEVALDAAADLLPPTRPPPSETTHRPALDGLDAWAAPAQPLDSSWFEAPGAPAGRPGESAPPQPLHDLATQLQDLWMDSAPREETDDADTTDVGEASNDEALDGLDEEPAAGSHMADVTPPPTAPAPGTVAPAQPNAPVADPAQVIGNEAPRQGRTASDLGFFAPAAPRLTEQAAAPANLWAEGAPASPDSEVTESAPGPAAAEPVPAQPSPGGFQPGPALVEPGHHDGPADVPPTDDGAPADSGVDDSGADRGLTDRFSLMRELSSLGVEDIQTPMTTPPAPRPARQQPKPAPQKKRKGFFSRG